MDYRRRQTLKSTVSAACLLFRTAEPANSWMPRPLWLGPHLTGNARCFARTARMLGTRMCTQAHDGHILNSRFHLSITHIKCLLMHTPQRPWITVMWESSETNQGHRPNHSIIREGLANSPLGCTLRTVVINSPFPVV